jgi:hypothetical protein
MHKTYLVLVVTALVISNDCLCDCTGRTVTTTARNCSVVTALVISNDCLCDCTGRTVTTTARNCSVVIDIRSGDCLCECTGRTGTLCLCS